MTNEKPLLKCVHASKTQFKYFASLFSGKIEFRALHTSFPLYHRSLRMISNLVHVEKYAWLKGSA